MSNRFFFSFGKIYKQMVLRYLYWTTCTSISISLTSLSPFEKDSFKIGDIIEPSTLCLHFMNLCFTTTAICSKTVCYIAIFSMLGTIHWVIFCKKLNRSPLLFLCIVKRDNSYYVCVCFLMMTNNACFWRIEAGDVWFSFTIMEIIWWVNHVKSLVGKSWAQILI